MWGLVDPPTAAHHSLPPRPASVSIPPPWCSLTLTRSVAQSLHSSPRSPNLSACYWASSCSQKTQDHSQSSTREAGRQFLVPQPLPSGLHYRSPAAIAHAPEPCASQWSLRSSAPPEPCSSRRYLRSPDCTQMLRGPQMLGRL